MFYRIRFSYRPIKVWYCNSIWTLGQCVSISFNSTWFRQNALQDNRGFQTLKQELDEFESLSVLGIMSTSKKTLVDELLGSKWKLSFGTFYVMSAILKIVNEVLHRINERESLSLNQLCLEKQLPELEKYIR